RVTLSRPCAARPPGSIGERPASKADQCSDHAATMAGIRCTLERGCGSRVPGARAQALREKSLQPGSAGGLGTGALVDDSGERGAPRVCLGLALTQAEKEEPQPHVLFTFGFPNLKPEPWRPST